MPERGAEVSESFYRELIAPVLQNRFPELTYAAARLGSGSDVLGLDDERSADHDFGCRLNLLLDRDFAALVAPVRSALEESLPESFRGWPVRFTVSWRPSVAVNADVDTVGDFVSGRLGVDPTHAMGVEDWLCLTGQAVLEVVAGPVFYDRTRELSTVREVLAWYPDDLWLYVLSAGWARLGQELPFVGRAGERGDEAGSKVIAARLARDIIHLGFLVERRWSPYPKWTGSALRRLPLGPDLADQLDRALSLPEWRARQDGLAAAIELLADRQSSLGLPSARPAVTAFFDRPFLTPVGAVHDALWEAIADEDVRRLPKGVGSVEQWSDSVDVLSHPLRRMALRTVYGQWSTEAPPVGNA